MDRAASQPLPPVEGPVTFDRVRSIVGQRCVTCHSPAPTFPGITQPPAGVLLNAPAGIAQNAQRIYQQVVVTRIMPLGNATKITDQERAVIAAWVAAARAGPIARRAPGARPTERRARRSSSAMLRTGLIRLTRPLRSHPARMRALAASGVRAGSSAKSLAARLVTCGDAMEVPLSFISWPPGIVLSTSKPLAWTFTIGPKLEKDVSSPAWSTAPTVIMFGS